VIPGQKLKDMNIVLTPQGAITGRILDRNGRPVSRAIVQASQYAYYGPVQGRSLVAMETVTTDDLGNYRLFWLTPGSYFVSANAEGSRISTILALGSGATLVSSAVSNSSVVVTGQTRSDGTAVEESWVPAYYPGTARLQEATPVVVRGGATVGGIDIAILSVPVHRIRGITINGNTGMPESLEVRLFTAWAASIGGVHYSSDGGVFEFAGVAPGDYLLLVQSVSVTPIHVENADVVGVTLNAALTSFTINGRISAEGLVSNGPALNRGSRIRLTSKTPSFPPLLLTEINGREFTVRGLFAGDYQLTMEGNSNQYVKSVRFGNQDGMDGFHVQSPNDGQLDIVLSSSFGSIDGRIVNQRREPVANATVVLIPDPPLRQRTSMYITPAVDVYGKFHLDAMPGQYKVFAWEDVEPGAWLDSAFMNAYESRGRPVTVSDGSKDSIEVSVIPYVP